MSEQRWLLSNPYASTPTFYVIASDCGDQLDQSRLLPSSGKDSSPAASRGDTCCMVDGDGGGGLRGAERPALRSACGLRNKVRSSPGTSSTSPSLCNFKPVSVDEMPPCYPATPLPGSVGCRTCVVNTTCSVPISENRGLNNKTPRWALERMRRLRCGGHAATCNWSHGIKWSSLTCLNIQFIQIKNSQNEHGGCL